MSSTTRVSFDVEALRDAYSATWAAHDPDRIVALHTQDTHFQTHIGTPPVVGREAMRETCAEIFATYENWRAEGHRFLAGERHWVLEFTLTATMSHEVDGQQVRKEISVDCVDVVVLSDEGLVASKDTYMDAGQLAAAMA